MAFLWPHLWAQARSHRTQRETSTRANTPHADHVPDPWNFRILCLNGHSLLPQPVWVFSPPEGKPSHSGFLLQVQEWLAAQGTHPGMWKQGCPCTSTYNSSRHSLWLGMKKRECQARDVGRTLKNLNTILDFQIIIKTYLSYRGKGLILFNTMVVGFALFCYLDVLVYRGFWVSETVGVGFGGETRLQTEIS